MKPIFKPKFATPIATEEPALNSSTGLSEGDIVLSKSSCAVHKSKTVSLTDSQYDEIFASVSRRVLEGDFLDLDERFAGSQDAIENVEGLHETSETQPKKPKKKRKRRKEIQQIDVSEASIQETRGETPLENYAKSISKISTDMNKCENEVTPSVSPHEQNAVVIKKPKPQKKRKPPLQAKRKSLEYSENAEDGISEPRSENNANLIPDTHDQATWVQCSQCEKWRLLPDCNDPALLPDVWTCSMNTNVELAKCSVPEENWDVLDSQTEYVYTKFAPGSLVWAKMDGYPPWPAMIDVDPDNNTYFEMSSSGEMSYYHVVFLDEKVSRAWITGKKIDAYRENETPIKLWHRDSMRRGEFGKEVNAARMKAQEAASMTVTKRISIFSFRSRFHGKSHWSKDRNTSEKSLKRKAKQDNPLPNSKLQKVDETSRAEKHAVRIQSVVEDKSSDLDKNSTSQSRDSVDPSPAKKVADSVSDKEVDAVNGNRDCVKEACESKNTSVVSMSDVSLERTFESVLQQGALMEDCNSSLDLPFVTPNKKFSKKPIEFNPDVFTMDMNGDGFTETFDISSLAKHSEKNNEVAEAEVLDSKKSLSNCDWISPSKNTGISASNMFDHEPARDSNNEDGSENWDDLEKLVIDIPDCL